MLQIVGDRIKTRRENLGLSTRELSARCGFSRTVLWRIENARADVYLGSLATIANELELPLSQLFADNDG